MSATIKVNAERTDLPDTIFLAYRSYSTERDGELSFVEGDEIAVLRHEDEWWCGELQRSQVIGWFPPSFGHILMSGKLEMKAAEGSIKGALLNPYDTRLVAHDGRTNILTYSTIDGELKGSIFLNTNSIVSIVGPEDMDEKDYGFQILCNRHGHDTQSDDQIRLCLAANSNVCRTWWLTCLQTSIETMLSLEAATDDNKDQMASKLGGKDMAMTTNDEVILYDSGLTEPSDSAKQICVLGGGEGIQTPLKLADQELVQGNLKAESLKLDPSNPTDVIGCVLKDFGISTNPFNEESHLPPINPFDDVVENVGSNPFDDDIDDGDNQTEPLVAACKDAELIYERTAVPIALPLKSIPAIGCVNKTGGTVAVAVAAPLAVAAPPSLTPSMRLMLRLGFKYDAVVSALPESVMVGGGSGGGARTRSAGSAKSGAAASVPSDSDETGDPNVLVAIKALCAAAERVWRPPLSCKIVSWLPNDEDFSTGEMHTTYTLNCRLNMFGHMTWRIERRYADFVRLNKQLSGMVPKAALKMVTNKFPDDGLFKFLTTLDDAKRDDRMRKINLWFAELVVLHQVLTIPVAFNALVEFIGADTKFRLVSDAELIRQSRF